MKGLFTAIRDKNCPRCVYNTKCDRLCTILAEEGLALLPNVDEAKIVTTPTGSTYTGIEIPDERKFILGATEPPPPCYLNAKDRKTWLVLRQTCMGMYDNEKFNFKQLQS